MPPRRRVRGDDDDGPLISRGGAAVSSDLPPLAARLDTSYGSAPSNTLRNTRRGQRRDLQSIIKETLHDSDDPDDPDDPGNPDDDDDDDSEEADDDDHSSERSKSTRSDRQPPVNSPSPNPVPKPKPMRKPQPAPNPGPDPDPNSNLPPDFGLGRDSSESSAPSRGPSPDRPSVKNPPKQRLPATIAPSIEPPFYQPEGTSSRQRVLPDIAPLEVRVRLVISPPHDEPVQKLWRHQIAPAKACRRPEVAPSQPRASAPSLLAPFPKRLGRRLMAIS
ncbi:hypothetical protein CH35J_000281 [Colletotrichum higginsianum]|uniref:Uncharacterized protein n=1 Tax=Colletotrichum higginsianum TaxID=80884 RepID=A0A4T0WKQ2_9PEZI|nr:hypothetical protein CH35J_000281 [Colletotrichum higginsianum]